MNTMCIHGLGFLNRRFVSADSFKHVRPGQLEEHQTGIWYPVIAPLRNRLSGYLADAGDFRCAAQVVNQKIRVHAILKHGLNHPVKDTLPIQKYS